MNEWRIARVLEIGDNIFSVGDEVRYTSYYIWEKNIFKEGVIVEINDSYIVIDCSEYGNSDILNIKISKVNFLWDRLERI